MKQCYNLTPPLYSLEERKRLVSKFDSIQSSIIEDSPAFGKKLNVKVIDLTNDVKNELQHFLRFARWSNEQVFGFKCHDFPLSVNWNTYGVGMEYPFHIDWNEEGMMADIKLTAIADLSDEEYKGGELEIYWQGHNHVIEEFVAGSILIFPSFVHHRVRPVTKGVRRSLSMWWTGPNWS